MIFILFILLLLLSFGLIVMVRTSGSKDAHESYERWKDRYGRVDKEK